MAEQSTQLTETQLHDLRTPPQNIEAEQALLGAILHNNMNMEKVSEIVLPEHFAHPAHANIYQAMMKLIDRGQIADPITLDKYFKDDELLKEVGGSAYLVELAGMSLEIVNPRDYALIIRDMYLRRQLIDLGEETVNTAHEYNLDIQANHLIEKAEHKLFNLATSGDSDKKATPFTTALTTAIEMAENAFKRDSHVVGVTTGLRDLDKMLGGFHPSDLIILAGRPSMGKTALATNIAFNAAKAALDGNVEDGAGVAFFSLEMSADQLANRILSSEAQISSDKIRRGEIQKSDFQKFTDVAMQLAKLNLFIDDTPALSVSALRTRARRLKRMHNIGFIVVDYLQLLQAPAGSRPDSRVQEISEITRSLKAIAKELNMPVLALSQLSRAVEQRDDKRPMLADLRESGSIEQDADVVMFVYREEYYLSRRKPGEDEGEKFNEWFEKMQNASNKAEVIIGKQRHGPIGTVEVYSESEYTKFSDLVPEHQNLQLAANS